MTQDKLRGCLFGAAFGDALGAEAEFKDVATIRLLWPPHGPTALDGNPARVTDDTQMMLAFGRALLSAAEPVADGTLSAATLEPLVRAQFIAWEDDPDNNRAPGRTCLSACAKLADGLPWLEASVRGSKGCGSNMRVMPAAFIPGEWVAPVAQLQAGMTHGHPTGLVAADATATALRMLAQGKEPLACIAGALAGAHLGSAAWPAEWFQQIEYADELAQLSGMPTTL